MVFNNKSAVCFDNSFKIDDEIIPTVFSFKYPGYHLDDKLSFTVHIDHISSKLACCNAVLSRASSFVPRNSLQLIFNAIGLSHVIYAKCFYFLSLINLLQFLSVSFYILVLLFTFVSWSMSLVVMICFVLFVFIFLLFYTRSSSLAFTLNCVYSFKMCLITIPLVKKIFFYLFLARNFTNKISSFLLCLSGTYFLNTFVNLNLLIILSFFESHNFFLNLYNLPLLYFYRFFCFFRTVYLPTTT